MHRPRTTGRSDPLPRTRTLLWICLTIGVFVGCFLASTICTLAFTRSYEIHNNPNVNTKNVVNIALPQPIKNASDLQNPSATRSRLNDLEKNITARLHDFARKISGNPSDYTNFCVSTTEKRLKNAGAVSTWESTVSIRDRTLLSLARADLVRRTGDDLLAMPHDQVTVLMNAAPSRFHSWYNRDTNHGLFRDVVNCRFVKVFVVNWWSSKPLPNITHPKLVFNDPYDSRLGARWDYHSKFFSTPHVLSMDDDNRIDCDQLGKSMKILNKHPTRVIGKTHRAISYSSTKGCVKFSYVYRGGPHKRIVLPTNGLFSRQYYYLYFALFPQKIKRMTDVLCEDIAMAFFQAALNVDQQQVLGKKNALVLPDALTRKEERRDASYMSASDRAGRAFRSGCYNMLMEYYREWNIFPKIPIRRRWEFFTSQRIEVRSTVSGIPG